MIELARGPVPVAHVAAISASGSRVRGLGRELAEGRLVPSLARQLAISHPGTLGSEVPELAPSEQPGDAKARKLMARAAWLAAACAKRIGCERGAEVNADEMGFFLGVGAAGGKPEELRAMLLASAPDGSLSLERFATAGLAATNPLFAFHLLNNLTLCHAAIVEKVRGPNAAFFSRGTGTLLALAEAMHAVRDGECAEALVGGSDTALHPATWMELEREGFAAQGLVPGEGAALLLLARHVDAALGQVEVVLADHDRTASLCERAVRLVREAGPVDATVLMPWGAPARAALRAAIDEGSVLDASIGLGDALAAAPALAWAVGLDLLLDGAGRVLVLHAGTDGDVGAVLFARGGP